MHKNTGVKSRRKSPVGKLRGTWEDNIKKDIKESIFGGAH
jgi:hypothetical protein